MIDEQLYDCGCPDDCDAVSLPTVDFADCPTGVTEEESEIEELYLDDITENPQSGAEEFANLPNSVASASVGWYSGSKVLYTIGDLPAADNTSRTIHKGWVKYGPSTWTLTVDILDSTADNYALIQFLQCNKGMKVGAAWKTRGGYIYGTAKASVVSADHILDRGEEAYAVGRIVLEIKAKCLPDREVDPELAPAA